MLAMRQTFQQWMVLLSALVLLLLPALLCYAAPMDPSASSSSGAPSDIENFSYYSDGNVGFNPNRKVLEGSDLEEHFGAELHYGGVPMFNVEKVPVSKVQDAMATYKRVWIVGRPSPTEGYKYMELIKGGGADILVRQDNEDDIRKHFLDAQDFERKYGSKALGLRYGSPFGERPKPKTSVLKWLRLPTSTKPKPYELEQTSISHLRRTLNQFNYLRVHDSAHHKLLSFKLDQDGRVLFEDLGRYLGRV